MYAVGDVHGNADLLRALLSEITRDAIEARPASRPLLIFVGDYVDRGSGSAEVLDLILSVIEASVFEVRPLKGNHEEAMLKFLEDPSFGVTWVQYGGAETLASYGVEAPREAAGPAAWREVQQAFARALPQSHRDFLENLELMIRVGDYAFVHAGIDLEEALENQVEHDVLWIRGEFLRSKSMADAIVVHGHTPAEQPEILPNRIGIDTGVYLTGLLTAIRLRDNTRGLIQAQAERSLIAQPQ